MIDAQAVTVVDNATGEEIYLYKNLSTKFVESGSAIASVTIKIIGE